MTIIENLIRDFPENLITFLLYPEPSVLLFAVKTIFIITAVILFTLTILLLFRATWLKYRILEDVVEFLTFKTFEGRKIEKKWQKIVSRINTGLESEYKLTIIEADNMMAEVLEKMGYKGSLGEKLEKITEVVVPNIEELKEAHKVRNNIVHDPNYKLSLGEVKKIVNILEKTFKDLEVF